MSGSYRTTYNSRPATAVRACKRAADWPDALPIWMLHEFDETLKRDYKTALWRFLPLQVQGSDNSRLTLRRLRAALAPTLICSGGPTCAL